MRCSRERKCVSRAVRSYQQPQIGHTDDRMLRASLIASVSLRARNCLRYW